MKAYRALLYWLLVPLVLAACDETTDPTPDAGAVDASPVDAVPGDDSPGDTAPVDGRPDAVEPGDSGPGDSGPGDAMRPPDAAFDAQPVDAQPVDAQPVDAQPVDAQPVDAQPVDAQPVDAAVDAQPVDAAVDAVVDAQPPDVGPCGDAPVNACGGCAVLPARPDAPCGECPDGRWACDGADAVICVGGERNPCGGCAALPGVPDAACGPCGIGRLACEGAERLACIGAPPPNPCGGCEPTDICREPPPGDPSETAPRDPATLAGDFGDRMAFLYAGPDAVQFDVEPGAFEGRPAVIRGVVRARDGGPLSGIRVAVVDRPALGHGITRADGRYDLVVPGGAALRIRMSAHGYLTAERRVTPRPAGFERVPDVALVPLSQDATVVDLRAPDTQVVRHPPEEDDAGRRQPTLLVPPGLEAVAVTADGLEHPLPRMTVRVTEYTVGADGPRAMPAELPPQSAYTYAAEFSVDEALELGASTVRFDRPIPVYLDNFLDLPVGESVPSGVFDRGAGAWVAARSGRIIAVLGIDDDGAALDSDGDGQPDDAQTLAALGISADERITLAALYAPGDALWRVPLEHFSPYDFNWAFVLPDCALPPEVEAFLQETGAAICEGADGEVTLRELIDCAIEYSSAAAEGRGQFLEVVLNGLDLEELCAEDVDAWVDIAGRRYPLDFEADGRPQRARVAWDGRDPYGRPLSEPVSATVRVALRYRGRYAFTPDFGELADLDAVAASATRDLLSLPATVGVPLDGWRDSRLGLGGFRLRGHHGYDPSTRRAHLGGGVAVDVEAPPTLIETTAGTGQPGFGGDGGPAADAALDSPIGLAAAPDGAIYIADTRNHRVRRIDADGTITTVAGTGVAGLDGDGGPATAARLDRPIALALAADGTLFIADHGNCRVRRLEPDGVIETHAGTVCGRWQGEGGSALAARMWWTGGIALAPDGALYLADGAFLDDPASNHAIRVVTPDGRIRTVVGDGVPGNEGDGGAARRARVRYPGSVALGRRGELYIADTGNNRIRVVEPDGRILPFAGTGVRGFSGDGGPALLARLDSPTGVTVGRDRAVYIGDLVNNRIRRVRPDGIIETVAGSGREGFGGDAGDPQDADLHYPAGAVVAADGSIWISDRLNHRLRRVSGAPGDDEVAVPDPEGRRVYVFDRDGRHLRTEDAATGVVIHRFAYADGLLVAREDRHGRRLSIERDGEGHPTALVTDGGRRTELEVDPLGRLVRIEDASGAVERFDYAADTGLVSGYTDPTGAAYGFDYDVAGRLTAATAPDGGGITRVYDTPAPDSVRVRSTSALERNTSQTLTRLPDAALRFDWTDPAGLAGTLLETAEGDRTWTLPDGSELVVLTAADPRWGPAVRFAADVTLRIPDGPIHRWIAERDAILADADDPLSIRRMVERFGQAEGPFELITDAEARQIELRYPSGRRALTDYDVAGRIVQATGPLAPPLAVEYDARGRPVRVEEGAGPTRAIDLRWSDEDELLAITGADGSEVRFERDGVGRVVGVEDAAAQRTGFERDANGRIIGVTPAERPAHGLSYDPVGRLTGWTPPPDADGEETRADLAYDLDGGLMSVEVPTHLTRVERDAAGRLIGMSTVDASLTVAYDAQGRSSRLTDTRGSTLEPEWSGPLLTALTWGGVLDARLELTHGADLRVESWRLDDGPPVAVHRDADGLPLGEGPLTLVRDPETGWVIERRLGDLVTEIERDAFGAPAVETTRLGAQVLHRMRHVFDDLGRVVTEDETWLEDGALREEVTDYTYDAAGRLVEVWRDGELAEQFAYDANDNRVLADGEPAIFDAQDRLLEAGPTLFEHTPDGQRSARLAAGETRYGWHPWGPLTEVITDDDVQIGYGLDPLGRRVARAVDGVRTDGFVYRDDLTLRARQDGAGATAETYLYGERWWAPAAVERADGLFLIATDLRGSPRMLLDARTGEVVLRRAYSAYGRIRAARGPDDLPLGFAGGLYDPDSGLLHFGVRSYDPETGRWLSRDPIGLAGGPNAYAYVGGDPVNRIDPDGRVFWLLFGGVGNVIANPDTPIRSFLIGAAGGGLGRLAGGALAAGRAVPLWRTVAGGALTGAVSGATTTALNEVFGVTCAENLPRDIAGSALVGMLTGGAGGAFGRRFQQGVVRDVAGNGSSAIAGGFLSDLWDIGSDEREQRCE